MTTITCKIPDVINAWLEALCRQQHISKSMIIRRALEQNLKFQKTSSKAYDLVKKLSGSLKSKVNDLSTNPKYLEGFGE